MSAIKVQNIRDYSGNTGFTLNANNTITLQGSRLSVENLQINGTITGTGEGANAFLPSQSGQSGRILYTNGTVPSWAAAPSQGNISSMQVFTSGGTWNKPTGVRYIHVQVIGGGGGGSGHGESGGSGGYSEEIIDVSGISSVSVSVSGESNGTYYRGGGGNGGSSSFGGYLSASGGYGANRNNQHSGGLGGVGSGGNLNIYGGGGESHHARAGMKVRAVCIMIGVCILMVLCLLGQLHHPRVTFLVCRCLLLVAPWNKPTGVRYIHVQVIGGGGGGSGHGESGGSGGYSEEIIDVSGISSVSVSVSGESNGTYYRGGGGNGGSSSFGGYLSASGGYGANRNNQHSGGLGGVGSGGNLNIYGGGWQQRIYRIFWRWCCWRLAPRWKLLAQSPVS
ncbi:gp39 [Synechococcus phage syn9]|uniref:Gp39 n=1 Tax=Synechococcus phage syn9 TaxID=382359 RepID=Q0QZI9_BPSYS|nr:tail fiber assembly [Synechococcus phage syn9]ABA47008.2 gp39 [Synechococcus phage syn9]